MAGSSAASADLNGNLETLSIRELKRKLTQRGLDVSGCLEKKDLLERLREAPSPHPGVSTNCTDSVSKELTRLPVAELRGLLKLHGVEEAGSIEKNELVAALAKCLTRCPICLDGESEDDKLMHRCDSCRTPFHRCCAAQHALSAAEQGSLPLLCPVPGCRNRWRAAFVAAVLHPNELERYNVAVRSVREMRQNSTNSGGFATMSPRTAEALRSRGIRPCPQCGALIEKQAAGLTHGCDKMTCRCGCKFCYHCGVVAGPGGMARCSCVGAHHSYLSHEDVLRNYDNFGSQGNNPFNGIRFNTTGASGSGTRSGFPINVDSAFNGMQEFANAVGMGDVMGQMLQAATRGTGSVHMPYTNKR